MSVIKSNLGLLQSSHAKAEISLMASELTELSALAASVTEAVVEAQRRVLESSFFVTRVFVLSKHV